MTAPKWGVTSKPCPRGMLKHIGKLTIKPGGRSTAEVEAPEFPFVVVLALLSAAGSWVDLVIYLTTQVVPSLPAANDMYQAYRQ